MTQTSRRVRLLDFRLAFGKRTRPLAWIDIARAPPSTLRRMATKNHV